VGWTAFPRLRRSKSAVAGGVMCHEVTLKNTAILLLSFLSAFVQAEVLVTPSAKATIVQQCVEGEVTCSKVKLELLELSSGSTVHAYGKTLHSTCSDGITPCAFQGWEFYNRTGLAAIIITQSGTVTMLNSEGEVTFEESGKWK